MRRPAPLGARDANRGWAAEVRHHGTAAQVQQNSAPRFTGRIEHLEERRVMAADMPLELMGASDALVNAAPPLEQHVLAPPLVQHGIGDADFWVDPSTQVGLDEYLQGVEKMLTQAHNLTGWFNVKNNYGFTGRGQTVAVIDSGIAYNHYALGGGFGSNYRVVGGWDFTEENDANPYDDGASGSHGTHVSGIIGSSDATNTGVAPGVDLRLMRVQ
jgi:subtilisin family serine protease